MKSNDVVWLYKLLTEKGIHIWLDGGWGVDALLGKQTRKHGDVDIVIQKKALAKLKSLLSEEFSEVQKDDSRDWNFVLGDACGREVDVHVVILDKKGNGIYGPKENNVSYPANSFNGRGFVDNYPVKCLTAEYQVKSHTGYKIDKKDVKDVSALCKKFNLEFPSEYQSLINK